MCDSREFCRSSRDSTIGINFDALGDVEHFEHVSGDLFDLFKSGENSDVVFVVGEMRFKAHRIILAARCSYFKVLLFGEMREARSGAEIPIVDTTPDAFHSLLEYIYSGRICLADLKEDVILDLLGLANKYDFAPLQTSIMAFLRATLNVTNVCLVYNVANYYQLRDLCFACSTFVDGHAAEVMKSDGFLSLSLSALTELCNRDSFFAPEIDIYRGIVRWVGHNEVETEVSRRLLQVVRLQLIPMEHLLGEIRGSKLFDPDHILDAIAMCTTKRSIELRQRGLLIPEENIATSQHDAVTVEGQVKDALLNGDTENYNGEQGYTTHTISLDSSKGITVQLGQPYLLNCIRMLLWDRDNRSYSYYVQVSLDKEHWVMVVDRTEHLCRSWQELLFDPIVVRSPVCTIYLALIKTL
ncbi:BTB/POZ domain-containing protein 9, partial [Geodia barretti]